MNKTMIVTNARPPLYSCLKVNSHSFHHASSPRLWNELPKELGQPVADEPLSLSSHLTLTSSSSYHHHFHYESLVLSSTPDSKLTFSIIPPAVVTLPVRTDGSHGF